MKTLDSQLIDEIRKRSDIVDVISQYLPVEKKGKSYVCLCPFHDDRSPSLMISKEKQIYRCFACGASGSVFKFVENYEKISFRQAVAKLGSQLGFDIQLGTIERKIDPEKKPYYDILQATIDYTQFQLFVSDVAKTYLYHRSISESQVEKFQIGYDDGKLEHFLKEKGYSYELMQEAYLIHSNINGSVDVFKERLLFPIHDFYGNPVGFTGRTLTNAAAKYINTAETKVYQKGELLYNYHRVKANEKTKDKVYLVEGTMDVIAFDKAGIEDCVAMLGTAITTQQMKALKRLNTKIYVCLDGDEAGRNATFKFGELATQLQLPFEIVDWNSEKDPDEFLTKEGKEKFLQCVENTISWIQFLFQHLKTKYNLNNYSDKKSYAEIIANYIHQEKDEIEKKAYFDVLKQQTNFDYSLQKVVVREKIQPKEKIEVNSNIEKAQLEIINQMIISKRACDIFKDELGMLPNESFNMIAKKIIQLYHEKIEITLSEMLDQVEENQMKLLILLQEDELFVHHFDEQIVQANIALILMHYLEEEQKKLAFKIFNEPILEKKEELIKQSIAISQQILKYKNHKGGH